MIKSLQKLLKEPLKRSYLTNSPQYGFSYLEKKFPIKTYFQRKVENEEVFKDEQLLPYYIEALHAQFNERGFCHVIKLVDNMSKNPAKLHLKLKIIEEIHKLLKSDLDNIKKVNSLALLIRYQHTLKLSSLLSFEIATRIYEILKLSPITAGGSHIYFLLNSLITIKGSHNHIIFYKLLNLLIPEVNQLPNINEHKANEDLMLKNGQNNVDRGLNDENNKPNDLSNTIKPTKNMINSINIEYLVPIFDIILDKIENVDERTLKYFLGDFIKYRRLLTIIQHSSILKSLIDHLYNINLKIKLGKANKSLYRDIYDKSIIYYLESMYNNPDDDKNEVIYINGIQNNAFQDVLGYIQLWINIQYLLNHQTIEKYGINYENSQIIQKNIYNAVKYGINNKKSNLQPQTIESIKYINKFCSAFVKYSHIENTSSLHHDLYDQLAHSNGNLDSNGKDNDILMVNEKQKIDTNDKLISNNVPIPIDVMIIMIKSIFISFRKKENLSFFEDKARIKNVFDFLKVNQHLIIKYNIDVSLTNEISKLIMTQYTIKGKEFV